MTTRQIPRPLIAALSLTLVSTVALASPASYGSDGKSAKGNCAEPQAHQFMAKRHDMHSTAGLQLPADVVEKLNLTDAQKLVLFNAQTASRAMRESMRQGMGNNREAHRQQMQSGNFDPRALFEQQDQRMARAQEARKAIQNQWLGFWDSLNDEQKSILRQQMQARTKDGGKRG